MRDVSKKIKEMGPIGKGEGIDPSILKRNLEVAQRLVPYIKLVEREKFRIRAQSLENYNDFFTHDEFNQLFKELIADKFELAQIMALLREKPCSNGEISSTLGITPSEVSKRLKNSARQGLGQFDESQNLYRCCLQ
jgi:F420-non-reducing hydrogenase iron-sulfur subunit